MSDDSDFTRLSIAKRKNEHEMAMQIERQRHEKELKAMEQFSFADVDNRLKSISYMLEYLVESVTEASKKESKRTFDEKAQKTIGFLGSEDPAPSP